MGRREGGVGRGGGLRGRGGGGAAGRVEDGRLVAAGRLLDDGDVRDGGLLDCRASWEALGERRRRQLV